MIRKWSVFGGYSLSSHAQTTISISSAISFQPNFAGLLKIPVRGNFKSLQKCLKILAVIRKWSVFGGYSLSSHAQTTISISSAISFQPNFAGLLKLPPDKKQSGSETESREFMFCNQKKLSLELFSEKYIIQ